MMYLNEQIFTLAFLNTFFVQNYFVNKSVKILEFVFEYSLTFHIRLLPRFTGIPCGNPLLFLAQLPLYK